MAPERLGGGGGGQALFVINGLPPPPPLKKKKKLCLLRVFRRHWPHHLYGCLRLRDIILIKMLDLHVTGVMLYCALEYIKETTEYKYPM